MSRVRTINNAALSSSTGNTPAADLYQVARNVSATITHGSTKTIGWIVQGSMAGVHWRALSTTTTSTGVATVALTSGTQLFNSVRINVASNVTTGDVTTRWVIGATP